MGLLDFLRKRARAETRAKLGRFLQPREVETWWRLLRQSSGNLLVAPRVPLILLLEDAGGLDDDLLGEEVPFVVVTSSGFLLTAYVREGQERLARTLRALGLDVRSLEEALSVDIVAAPASSSSAPSSSPLSAATPPPPAEPLAPPSGGAEEAKGAEAEGPALEALDVSSLGEPVSTPSQGKEGGSDLYTDLAREWWSGRFDLRALFSSPPSAPKPEKEDKSAHPRPEGEEGGPRVAGVGGERSSKRGESAATKGEQPVCPLCGAPMVLRTARQGKRAGQQFWSCSRFPECKGTRPYRSPTDQKKEG